MVTLQLFVLLVHPLQLDHVYPLFAFAVSVTTVPER
jgi:hypothetical protein